MALDYFLTVGYNAKECDNLDVPFYMLTPRNPGSPEKSLKLIVDLSPLMFMEINTVKNHLLGAECHTN